MTTIYRDTENKLLKVEVEDHYKYLALLQDMYIRGRKYIIKSIEVDVNKDRRNIILYPTEDLQIYGAIKIDWKYKAPI